jgi:hypothetical protein
VTRVAVWRNWEGLSLRASQFSPRVTASDVPALNLLQLHQQSHCACQRVYRSVEGRMMHHACLPTVNPQVHRDSAPHH